MSHNFPTNPILGKIFRPDETVYIVAGGPSLKTFNWDFLSDKTSIAINKSLYKVPSAKVLWWSDERFFRSHRAAIESHKASFKATAYISFYREQNPPWVNSYKFTKMRGYDETPDSLCHGNNSGYAAIHLAIKTGAKKIVLLGYDFKFDEDGSTHWHDGHHDENGRKFNHGEDSLTKNMLPNFKYLQIPALQHGVEIINANPESNLNIWPKRSLDDITNNQSS